MCGVSRLPGTQQNSEQIQIEILVQRITTHFTSTNLQMKIIAEITSTISFAKSSKKQICAYRLVGLLRVCSGGRMECHTK